MPERIELEATSWSEVRGWLVGHGRLRVPRSGARPGARIEVKLRLPSGLAVGFTGDLVDPAGGLIEVEPKKRGDLDLLEHMVESELETERLTDVLTAPSPRRAPERKAAGTPTPVVAGARETVGGKRPARKPRESVVVPELDLGSADPGRRRVEAPSRSGNPDDLAMDGFQVEVQPAARAPDDLLGLLALDDLGPPPGSEPISLADQLEPEPPGLALDDASSPLGGPDALSLDEPEPPSDEGEGEGEGDDEFDIDLSSVDLPPAPVGPTLLDASRVGAPLVLEGAAEEADEPLSGGPVLGIGFGTTRAEVAIVSGGKVFLATDEHDHPGVPALVQIPARDRQGNNVSVVISGMKRLLGRRPDDPTNAGWLAQQSWRQAALDGHVAVQLGGRPFGMPQLLGEVLKRLKLQAETALGDPATDAVLAVPLGFAAEQRAALRQAAKLAGLRVVGLVPEPLAACAAFGLGRAKRELVLVFDLGGGTLDIAVLEGQCERFAVRASVGDPWLGGEDFDRALAGEALRGLDPLARSAVDQARLLAAAEVAKVGLSSADEVTLEIPMTAGKPRPVKLDGKRFAQAAAGLVAQAGAALERALEEAGVVAADVQQVLLTGGMTRAPLVRALVGERFGRLSPQVVGPDEAVALGAALQGQALLRARRRR